MSNVNERHLVVVGLGNPGKKYTYTRHNIGFLTVNRIAHSSGLNLKEEKRFLACSAKGVIQGVQVHLVLPMTYMNESGQAVRQYLDYYKLAAEDLVVIVDDVNIAFRTMRFRESGSAGGHNGLKSIEAHLGTRDYRRLRMGVGKSINSGDLADYVLDTFAADEMQELPAFIEQGAEAVKRMIMNCNIADSAVQGQENKHESN